MRASYQVVTGLVVGLVIGATGALAWSNAGAWLVSPLPKATSNIDSRFPQAKNSAEIRLFAASEKSCKLIRSTGMRARQPDGSSVLTALVGFGSGEQVFATVRTEADGTLAADSAQIFSDGVPVPCMAESLTEQYRRKADPVALGYLIDRLGSPPGGDGIEQFVLHMHTQSSSVSNTGLSVANGLIVGFADSGPVENYAADGSITYDLSKDERDAIQLAINPNN